LIEGLFSEEASRMQNAAGLFSFCIRFSLSSGDVY